MTEIIINAEQYAEIIGALRNLQILATAICGLLLCRIYFAAWRR